MVSLCKQTSQQYFALKMYTFLHSPYTPFFALFEKFYQNSKIVTSTTPAEKPPLLDSVKFKDGSTTTVESLPEQDANLQLPATDDLLQELEWNDILWNDSLSESGDFDILDTYT